MKLHQSISCPVDGGGKQVSFIVLPQQDLKNKYSKLPVSSNL